jgi:pimeloyl-ACP methyl ester carboxylesterase
MRTIIIAAITLSIVALAVDVLWVDSKTRAAAPRDGGQIIESPIVPANVKVGGRGPAIVFIHGFGGAIDWWGDIAPDLPTDHRIIRIDLIGHGGTAAPSSGYERVPGSEIAIIDGGTWENGPQGNQGRVHRLITRVHRTRPGKAARISHHKREHNGGSHCGVTSRP